MLTALQWLLSFDPKRRFYFKCRVWFAAGKLVEARRHGKPSGFKINGQPESV